VSHKRAVRWAFFLIVIALTYTTGLIRSGPYVPGYTERRLGLPLVGMDLTLEHYLRKGRNLYVDRLALHHLKGVAQPRVPYRVRCVVLMTNHFT
jgi:hypothetical protein